MNRTIYSEKQLIASNENLEEKNYWLKKLSGDWIKSSFPYDCEKTGENRTCQLETITFKFTDPIGSMINKITGGSDYTLHILLVAGLVEILRRYSNTNDIILATPIYKQELDREFINTVLAIRNRLTGRMSFKELLLQVKETIREAAENQNYPISILAEKLNLPVSEMDFPLFDIAVLLENVHNKKYLQQNAIPFSLVFSYYRGENQLIEGKVEYNSLLYKPSTIEGIITHLTQLFNNALPDVNVPLSSIEILSEEEKKQLLVEFNSTRMDYPGDKTIHRLFEEQVKKTPDDTAVIETDGTRRIDYKELNEKANRLARLLRKKGVGADRIVGIMMDNSIEMITGILSILKAGGAYLPIDPALPQKRVLTMLNDSGAAVFLTKDKLLSKFKFIPFQNFEEEKLQKIITPTRPQVMNLDSLQVPDRSLVDYEKYHPFIGQSMVKNSITLQYSRGCMFKCLYCFRIWPDKYSLRSGENLFEEVNMYYKLGVRRFGFTDDLPNFNKKEIGKFYRLVIKNKLKIHMHFPNGIRGDILTPDFIDLIMEAGAVTMDLALETASPRLQKLIRKNVNIDRLRRNVEYIIEKYPHAILGVQIMHGFPTETEEEAKASLEFIKSFRWLPFGYMHILKIYPNTAMARFAMEHGVSEEDIIRSMDLGYHELPYTLPFPESFTRQCQSEYLGEFFLVKERLLNVLPNQMSMLTEDELVQKYNSYLPADIKTFPGLLKYLGISGEEIKGEFLPEDYGKVENFNEKVRRNFPVHKSNSNATRLLLLDLSQHFTHESQEMYHVVDPPLGLMYLLTHLNKTFGPGLNGKIAKSQVDFDNYDELKELIEGFNPHIIGIRTLTYFKDFFHKAISLIRQWGFVGPIIAGGPYATSSYETMLQDMNVDLAVLREGEITTAELMTSIMNNEGKLPDEDVLKDIKGIAFVGKEEKTGYAWMNREILLMEHIESILRRESAQNPAPINLPTDMAYVIYTSGSTGIAKGVMMQHHNVVNQLTGLKRKFGLDPSLNYLLLAAFTFDVSVMHMFSALSTGAKLFLITEEIKKDPLKLWQYIYKNKINILNIVPAFMKAILENIENKKINFRYLFVGGDVFEPELYEKLAETFEAGTIINIYGPTETTINASLYPCNHIARNQRIPIGKPLMNYKAYILDSDLNLVPIGGTGELCISGEGVARGYLNRPELTAAKFDHDLWDHRDKRKKIPGKIYKSGDLARWLPDGNIDFLGRRDNQVKIRGFRIEPGEIEKRFLEIEQIKEAVVVAKEDESGDKYLCAYVTSDKNVMTTELRECLKEELPDYMIPTYIIQIDKMPFTTSHKIDTRVLKEKQLGVIGNYVPPADEIEMELAGIWAEILNIDIEQMGVNTNFFDLGGHSLRATILISKIHKKMNVKVPLGELFKTPTVRGLSAYIKKAAPEKFLSIEPAEKKEYYPLSSPQARLYFIQQLDINSTVYNMTTVIPLEGPIDKNRIEEAFGKLIKRHESLRTSFETLRGNTVQKIHEPIDFKVKYHDRSAAPPTTPGIINIRDFIEPFNLAQAPLLRAVLIKEKENQYLLIADMHHITSDGVSHEILTRDFTALAAGEELPALRLQYKDYSLWQQSPWVKKEQKQQEEYWIQQFKGEIPVLNIPTDFPRPTLQSFVGSAAGFEVREKETVLLNKLAQREEATLFMVLLALYNIFLWKLIGQDDIVVGSPFAGRKHADLEKIIGMFVNTIALRNFPNGEQSFTSFLRQVKKRTLNAIENQDYPFETLIEKVAVERDMSHNPLFDVSFSVQDIFERKGGKSEEDRKEDRGRDRKEEYVNEHQTSKFDLTLIVNNAKDRLYFVFEYCTELFTQETILRFIAFFKRIVSAVAADPGQKIAAIEIMEPEEKKRLLYEFNQTGPGLPLEKTIDELYRGMVNQSPRQTAVVSVMDLTTIYDELETGAVRWETYEDLEKCSFKKNPYLFYYEDNRFLKALKMIDEKDADQLVLLRTNENNFAAVNYEVLLLLDCLDGQCNLKSLYASLAKMENQYWLPLIIDVETLQVNKSQKRYTLNGDDGFGELVALIKALYRANLIELADYHWKILPLDNEPDRYRIKLKEITKKYSAPAAAREETRTNGAAGIQPGTQKGTVLLLGDRAATATVGLLYIASYLRRNGIEAYCQWYDFNSTTAALKENIKQLLTKIQPKIVGVSMKWFPHIARVLEICKTVKNYNPDIQVVVGGDTASYYKEKVIDFEWIDYVVAGDGELPFLKICQGEKDIPNCIYKQNGKIIKTPITYVQDEKNSADIYLSHLEKIFVNDLDPYIPPSFYINTGKGCSQECFYCGVCRSAQEKAFNRTMPFIRRIEEVRKDLIVAKKYASRFMFDFDLPLYNSLDYYKKIWEGIDLSNHFCQFYYWMLPSKEFIRLVVKTFKYVYINIDICSLSERHRQQLSSLKVVKPQPTDAELFELFDECEKYDNVEIIINHITGLPFFTYEDIEINKKMLSRLMERYPYFVDMEWGRLHAQPGAPVMESAEKYGMHSFAKTFEDFLHYSELNLQDEVYPKLFTYHYPYIYFDDERLNSQISKFYEEADKKMKDHRRKKRRRLNVVQPMTYEELDRKSDQLGRALIRKGAAPADIVGLYAQQSLEMIIGLLGILKAGAVYLPIDMKYPGERINYMLKDSGAKILITQEDLRNQVEALEFKGDILYISNEVVDTRNLHPGPLKNIPTPQSPAYVIYTSGSTGKPKGVMVEHRNVVRLVKDSNYIEFKEDDRLLLTGSIAFDITTFEIWAPLLNGIILFLAHQNITLEAEQLRDCLDKNEISILHLIPQLFNQLADQLPEIFAGLRYLMVGGDLVRAYYVNAIRNRYKDLAILHMYGPTENTTFSTYFPVDKDYEITIPIGKPVGDTNVYIIDRYDKLLPIGVPGQLVVGGGGVARGYLNQPELTAEKFDRDSWDLQFYYYKNKNNEKFLQGGSRGAVFSKSAPPDRVRQKLYKTGDLARWQPDGNIEFIGRIDTQIKIRGFRIELGEIENSLLDINGIKEAVVLSKEEKGNKSICAYFVADREYVISELRDRLSMELPDYMLPLYFVPLEKIPLTPNGKIDRRTLLELTAFGPKSDRVYVEPREELEIKIASIWHELFQLEKVGIFDDFFELGGDSLKITQLKTMLSEELNKNISVVDLFQYPTISSFVEKLKKNEENEAMVNDQFDRSEKFDRAKGAQRNIRERRKKRSENA